MKKKYEARTGSPFKKGQAQIYGERLGYIAGKNKGKITPISVVRDGKSISSPFYNYFEWNNKKASDQYRLQQARNLINHIIEVVVIEGKPSKQRSFFNVRNGGGKTVYVSLKTAVTNKPYRIQILNQLITVLENTTELMRLFRSFEK